MYISVHVNLCVHAYICVCMYHIHGRTHAHTHVQNTPIDLTAACRGQLKHKRALEQLNICIFMYICVHVYIYIYMHSCMYVYMHMCGSST